MPRLTVTGCSSGSTTLGRSPEWYKDAIIYEVRVSSFFDANGDGVGDFTGLERKLPYLQDLGVTALWLLPFYPSPLRDDGYDIADYTNVHSTLGTLDDFKRFLDAAHHLDLSIITELVINHTSDRHPWFQRARRASKGSPEREFYVWSDDPRKFPEARIIFKDFESSNFTWDAVAQSYYWHRFFSHQPDLNFDNENVLDAVLSVLDFWLDLGVDGLRLDAIPYLVEREGTNCENLPETHEIIRRIRRHVDKRYPNRLLLAEANQWPEDTATYFGNGDECHMAFHFPIMPRLFMALRMEDRFPVVDILAQTPTLPTGCQWAMFLRNHDELTLEMVTEEEREYMWQVYASDPSARINLGIRRRLAPLLEGSRARIELMIALLLSLPGTPVLYYGDEIAMGDNMYLGDRNGVRTPMQWSADRNAGFSQANPQRLVLPVVIDPEYHYETINVENQQRNPESLLWWTKRILALRKQFRAFGRGGLALLSPKNPHVLAFCREHENETFLVVANLSRFVQHVELDLREFRGNQPLELFGRSNLARIGRRPYPLTIGPHGYYWLRLSNPERKTLHPGLNTSDWPVFKVDTDWRDLFGPKKTTFETALSAFLNQQRWFGGKGRTITRIQLLDALPLPNTDFSCFLGIVEVSFAKEPAERYLLPLALAVGLYSESLASRHPEIVIGEVVSANGEHQGLLHDAVYDREFVWASCRIQRDNDSIEQGAYRLTAHAIAPELPTQLDAVITEPNIRALGVQQSNSSVRIGDKYVLKLFRHIEEGENPELEIGRYLTQTVGFTHSAQTLSALTLRTDRGHEPATVAILQRFVPNEGDAWMYVQRELGRFYRAALTEPPSSAPRPTIDNFLALRNSQPDPHLRALFGPVLDSAKLIGQRTAEMHLAFATTTTDSAFTQEPFSVQYQRQLYQGFRSRTARTLRRLRDGLSELPESLRTSAESLVSQESEIVAVFEAIRKNRIDAGRIRIHGDYHLGQLLRCGNDFVIIDFEGEPARSISERKIKRCPLRDVAGMLRSFHYAAMNELYRDTPVSDIRITDRERLRPWSDCWLTWVSTRFVEGYFESISSAAFLPRNLEQITTLIQLYYLEKVLYEIDYELGHRPDWIAIPFEALQRLLTTIREPHI
jgi:maltose alpha-D-glucosyltransferase/alpha-amylase